MSDTTYRAGDSVRITRNYLDSLLVEMRQIDAVLPTTGFSLFGHSFSTPIMMAALSHVKNPTEGLIDVVRGTKAADTVAWIGDCSAKETEKVLATGAKTVVIIKPFADNDLILEKMQHAKDHGAIAVGVDIDHAFSRNGKYDYAGDKILSGKTCAELKQLAQATSLPFIIKGVLSTQDAKKCLEIGAGGIVVSHHGGIMDYAVPPLKVLPEIVKTINGELPIFVDCEIASGMDAFKALALGATAVSVGRPLLRIMRESGAEGVAGLIEKMTGELIHMMARTGAHDLSSIDPSVIWQL